MALNLYAGTGLATMYDIAARVGAGGRMEDKMYQRIVELQAQKNDIWQVMPFKPCNNGTKEVVQLRESLPDIAWRMINKGTKPVKTGTSQASYTTGGKEAFSNVDERALQMNKNSNMWRMTENDGVQTALSNQMSETIFYGDEKSTPQALPALAHITMLKKAMAFGVNRLLTQAAPATALHLCG